MRKNSLKVGLVVLGVTGMLLLLQNLNLGTIDGAEQLKVSLPQYAATITIAASNSSPRAKAQADDVMVLIPAGEFLMGSPPGGGSSDEHPQHRVYLDAYYIDKYPVTVAQYRKFCEATGREMPSNPEAYTLGWGWQDNNPIINVSWEDANAYARYYGNRLPTEAEWEKACRAGSTTKYCFGDDEMALPDYAWYAKNSNRQPHPVGTKKPNAFGIYDMHGNVWEWCADWYDQNYYANSPTNNPKGPVSGQYRVLRGCSFDFAECRSANRVKNHPTFSYAYTGFRTVHGIVSTVDAGLEQLKPGTITTAGDISTTKIDISFLPFFESVIVQTRATNQTQEKDKATLEVFLEKDGRTIKTFPPKEITCQAGKETVEKHAFDIKGVNPGRYDLSASLLKDKKVVSQARKNVRIYGPYIPVEERDFNYVLQEGRLYIGYPDYYRDADVFRTGYGPVKITYPWPYPLEKFVEYQMPFVICEGLFGPWGIQDEPYELARERIRGIIKEAEKIGGEYFLGVWLGELGDGIISRSHEISTGPPMNISHPVIHKQMIVPGEETRLGKADAYIKVIKHIKDDLLGLPPDKIFMTGNYYVSNQALEAEAGANVIIKESGVLGSFTQQMSLTRGVARSFRKRYGDVISAESLTGEAAFKMSPPAAFKWDIKTGRYDPNSKRKLEPPTKWTWSLEDAYKVFIERYYNGVNYLLSSNEHPQNSGEMVFNFLDFVDKNPRCKNIVSSVAILESKGNYMGSLHPLNFEETSRKNNCFEVFGLWKWLYPDNIPYKEEMDFLYLNSFFPKLTDDNVLYKHWWTGTPYGAVDRIYPAMRLEDMRKYNAIVFMGFHRMDSVREDFLKDLMKYVKDGGIIVLAADQMKNSKEEFNQNELKSLVGVSLVPDTRLKIKDYVKVVETTPFSIKNERYPIGSEVKLKEEKEPWVYKVTPEGAEVVATDSQGIPVLLLNKLGKGHIFLFTSPTLSMIPPVGKSPLVSEIIAKVCRYKPLPVVLSPENEDVEFLIARTEDKEASIFIMNHGKKDWEGDIVVNLARCGLSPEIWKKVSAKVSQGYKVREASPEVLRKGNTLVIKGIRVVGDTSEPADYNYLSWFKPHYSEQFELKTFCSYRQASFALVRLGERRDYEN